jgi:DNA-binding MarR family transcriptional regulator
LHEKIAARLAARQEEILAPLSANERRQLDRILERLTLHTAALPA